jgi:peroxiredoxin
VELQEAVPRLQAERIRSAVVLAQACPRIEESVHDAGAAYPFPLLCDPTREVIKRYGVWHPIGLDSFNTAHPASFLIGADRRVHYCFVGST